MSRFEIAADPNEVKSLRSAVRVDPTVDDIGERARNDLVLIVSELVSNAVAAAPRGTRIVVDIDRDGADVTVEVTNRGSMVSTDFTVEMPPGSVMRGRGLGIVRMLTRSVASFATPGHTTVRAVLDAT